MPRKSKLLRLFGGVAQALLVFLAVLFEDDNFWKVSPQSYMYGASILEGLFFRFPVHSALTSVQFRTGAGTPFMSCSRATNRWSPQDPRSGFTRNLSKRPRTVWGNSFGMPSGWALEDRFRSGFRRQGPSHRRPSHAILSMWMCLCLCLQ